MHIVSVETRFEMGHRLRDYDGRCRYLHGHSYRVCIEVKCAFLQEQGYHVGMVADFKWLKDKLKSVVDLWDHTIMLHDTDPICKALNVVAMETFPGNLVLGLGDFDTRIIMAPWTPTAEHMAQYICERLPLVGAVVVSETLTSSARYERPKQSG